MIPGAYDWSEDMLRMTSLRRRFRDSFVGTTLDERRWEVLTRGSGMTLSLADGSARITTGTTLDDELALLSRPSFRLPLRVLVALHLSQRIAGQTLWIELVSVHPETGQPDERNIAAWRVDGTSATLANYEVAGDGSPRLGTPSGVTIPTTAPSGWSVLELEPTSEECHFHTRLLDGTGQRAHSYLRQQQLPDPNALYKLRLRVRNRQVFHGITGVADNGGGLVRITRAAHGYASGDSVTLENVAGVPGANGTFLITVVNANSFDLVGSSFSGAYVNNGWASMSRNADPASSTELRLQFVTLSDYAELTTAITAGRGGLIPAQGVGVNVLNAAVAVGGQARNTAGALPVLAATGYAANPAAVTSARGVDLLATLIGALVTKPYAIPEADWSYAGPLSGLATGSDTPVQTAAGTGLRRYVTALQLQNASGTASEFQVKDGASVIWRALLPANLPPTDMVFPTPLRSSANTALNVQAVTAGAVVIANLQGFTAP
ncbi:ubiquitin-activating E1 FCCH domain-containing protein [Rubritepida flocculans]|jgi:hypothetical protein|uniref:ubiquitin-activating E1 FCCH domain-containing protein n=1 Tax=Rubritepida flocculans TaxID=182403 RepID=UPI0004225CE4|nr:ubiquitin-activating E1 FCCH domain-containing protein [Rubritepida flocculans]